MTDLLPEAPYDAGAPIVLDAGDLFEGGIACTSGGELEEEPNDTPAEANELRSAPSGKFLVGTRCGVAFGSDAGVDGGDRDYLKFELADASTRFFVQYAGNVNVMVETDGQAPVDITSNPPPKLKFVRGQPYSVEVRSADGKTRTWRVSLFQEPAQ